MGSRHLSDANATITRQQEELQLGQQQTKDVVHDLERQVKRYRTLLREKDLCIAELKKA
jgi:hypothetical protein